MNVSRKVSRWLIMVLVLSALTSGLIRADSFESGNQFYEQGKFAEAKHEYEMVLAERGPSANLYYNLGNTDFRLGSTGRAILNYERALSLNPRHPEALANLRRLREQSGARLPKPSWAHVFSAGWSTDFVVVATTVSGWMFLWFLVLLVVRRNMEKSVIWAGLVASASALAATGMMLGAKWKDEALAIIIEKHTEARLAPTDGASVAEVLPAGSRVRVLSERGAWIYCELPGAARGWIAQSALERVTPKSS